MTRFLNILHGFLLLLFCASCEHRPLECMSNGHHIRIYINDSIPNNTCNFYINAPSVRSFTQPEVMRLLLYDPISGSLQYDGFLQTSGKDQKGIYIEGMVFAEPGCYHLLAYNFGTESTIIRNEMSLWDIEASTNPIAEHLYNPKANINRTDQPRPVFEPDHLFVISRDNVRITPSLVADTIRDNEHNYFIANTIVDSYYIQIDVAGVKWVTKASAILSGMSGSMKLVNKEINESDAVDIYFDMGINIRPLKVDSDSLPKTATLFSTFNTFGKLSDKNTIMTVTFEFIKTNGDLQKDSLILTPMFQTNDVLLHRWLIIKRTIEVKPPETNEGMSPDVENWEDVNKDVIL